MLNISTPLWISLISAEWIPALSLWSSAIPLSLHVWDVLKSSRVEQQRQGKAGRDADSEEERKGKVLREQRERKADRELVIEVWCVGLWASVSCRGLQMALRIKSKLCWLPRNGLCDTSSATWGGGEGGGATLAQREEAEGEGCSHTLKIAFKWVFEISKNKLPLKKLNRQLIRGLDGDQVKSCPLPSISPHLSLFYTLASFIFSRLFTLPRSHSSHTPTCMQVL